MGSSFASIFNKATSDRGSAPITSALNSLLSPKLTVISSASSTTWLLVNKYPSSEIIKPDPVEITGLVFSLGT